MDSKRSDNFIRVPGRISSISELFATLHTVAYTSLLLALLTVVIVTKPKGDNLILVIPLLQR